jgi:hypothetical protein
MKKSTRRTALKTIAAAAAVPVANAQQHVHSSEVIPLSAPYTPKIFTPSEMKWVSALVDTIIPRTDTPGASDAGVPALIDRRLNANPKVAAQFREGMAALEAEAMRQFDKSYPQLTSDQQAALLTPIVDGAFFKLVKGYTVDAYYMTKEGLTQELGWHGNTFLTEFKGCTHPEHQS